MDRLSDIQKLISVYAHATGCSVRIYNCSSELVQEKNCKNSIESKICKFCPEAALKKETEPCRALHINAIEKSGHSEGIFIYSCKIGLVFWMSPLFNAGTRTGSLRGSGYIQHETQPDKTIACAEFTKQLKKIKTAGYEKIKSTAEMLLLCAATLSTGDEDYHDILRRRTGQQADINSRLAMLKEKYSPETAHEYPVKEERQLVSALRLGDPEAAISSLNDLLAVLLFIGRDDFQYLHLRATELAVLIHRAEKINSCGVQSTMPVSRNYITQIKNAKTFEELTDALHSLVKQIAGAIAPFRGLPHATAMRKAEQFIKNNFTRKILLTEIASVAGLSAPYFSTVFREEMGENFSVYLNRLRVEKAKFMLLESELPLSEIAGACCFEDQSWFSRVFKLYTGTCPGKFRKQGGMTIKEISDNNVSSNVSFSW
jgi:YesN/AraC family two-component response regulator